MRNSSRFAMRQPACHVYDMGSEHLLCESRKHGVRTPRKTIELSWDNNTMGYCDMKIITKNMPRICIGSVKQCWEKTLRLRKSPPSIGVYHGIPHLDKATLKGERSGASQHVFQRQQQSPTETYRTAGWMVFFCIIFQHPGDITWTCSNFRSLWGFLLQLPSGNLT